MISRQSHRKKKNKKYTKLNSQPIQCWKMNLKKLINQMNDEKSNIQKKKKSAHVTIWRELGMETEEIRGKTKEERK